MIKKVDGYLLTSSANHKYIVKVRPCFSTRAVDMFAYIKPTQRDFNPEVYILYVGTNDLSSNKSPEKISVDILNLAKSMKLNTGPPQGALFKVFAAASFRKRSRLQYRSQNWITRYKKMRGSFTVKSLYI